jgi:hypothetical protein
VKILLDVCTPVQVQRAFPEHEVQTAAKLGWRTASNGELLRFAENAGFALFIICDKNMRYQQQVLDRRLAILELWTNHRPTLELHFAYIRAAGERAVPGTYTVLPPP